MSRTRLFSIALGLSLLSQEAPAQAPNSGKLQKSEKSAWQWTLDERLAERFDPAAMKARHARRRAQVESIQAEWRAKGVPEDSVFDKFEPDPYSIEGNENPELFLPHELFSFLLTTCFPPEGDSHSRRRIEQRAAALGFGSDLWPRLERSAKPFLDLARNRHKLAMEVLGSTSTEIPEAEDRFLSCRLRADALSAAKAEFGHEAFLRLLYEAVAPNIGISGAPDQGVAKMVEDLRYQEGGCR